LASRLFPLEEENMFILQDVPQGKPGYRRLFG